MFVSRKLIQTLLYVAAATMAVMSSLPAPSAHTRLSQVTWAVDIAPIVRTRCAGCHRENGFGPMPLTTYEEARDHAKSIREEVLARRMPPWQAAPGYGDFLNDAALSPLEIELLTSWTDGNTPRGTAANSVTAEISRSRLEGAASFELPTVRTSGGLVQSTIDTHLSGDRWITGWEFVPGNPSLVEEAALRIAREGVVASWTPIEPAIRFPTGVAQSFPAGTTLTVDVRYRRSSEAQTDRSRLTLYFGERPLRPLHHRSVACGTESIAETIDLLTIRPRSAAAGDSIEVSARQPDQTVEPLVVVPQYAPGYSLTYRLRRPLRLAAGTVLTVRSSSPECSADVDFSTPAQRSPTPALRPGP